MTHRCPTCGDNAQELERFVLESTNEPIEHVRIRCTDGHHYTMLARDLATHG